MNFDHDIALSRPVNRTRSGPCGAVSIALLLVLACEALAIKPGRWIHTTEADFEPGETEQTVVTNLGDVKLAAASAVIGEVPEQVSIINDLAQVKDVLYLAGGPEAVLLRRKADQIEEVLSLEEEQIFSLVELDGKLLVGISGTRSRLAVLDGDTLADRYVFDEDIRYIWDMLVLKGTKRVIVATGVDGKILSVDLGVEEPEAKQLLDASQANMLCLGADNRGNIYAGTDTDGLIFRLSSSDDLENLSSFVIYDAPEPEIAALLVLPDGLVYAGTADAQQARPGRLKKAASEATGRPGPPAQEPKEEEEEEEEEEEVTPPPAPEPSDAPASPDDSEPPTPTASPDDEPNAAPSDDKPDKSADTDPGQLLQGVDTPVESLGTALRQKTETESSDESEPTSEQRDELRNVIRAQLEKARSTGELQAPTQTSRRQPRPPRRPTTPARPPARGANKGNAVYRIDPDGFAHEIFRESVMILNILMDQGMLLVGTGNEGQIYRLDPDAEETTIVADLEPEQLPTLLRADNEQIFVGTANPATLVHLDRLHAETGSYTSRTLDASQISLWGKFNLTADIPAGASVGLQTRSGNVEDPDQAAWSDWSEPTLFEHIESVSALAPREATVNSPPARFLQYRLTLSGTAGASAVVDHVELAYVMPNLKPVIGSIKASYGKRPGGQSGKPPRARPGARKSQPKAQTALKIEWQASDPNEDELRYRLEYRPAQSDLWLPLTKDELTENKHEWDTMRAPDGRYVIRVTASDEADNTPDMAMTTRRHADPVLVDNTPPDFEVNQSTVDQGAVVLKLRVADALSPIQSVNYNVDGAEKWEPILPEDLVFDSTVEALTIRIPNLTAGSHTITLRAWDAAGNVRYESQFVRID